MKLRKRTAIAAGFIVLCGGALLLRSVERGRGSVQPVSRPAPASGFYYVVGTVDRPGAYQFNGQTITVRRAVQQAGLRAAPEALSHIVVIRSGPAGQEMIKFYPVPLLRNGEQDEPLWPNDQVRVEGKL